MKQINYFQSLILEKETLRIISDRLRGRVDQDLNAQSLLQKRIDAINKELDGVEVMVIDELKIKPIKYNPEND